MMLPGLIQFRLCKLDNDELAKRVAEGLNKMYDTGRIPDRYIPARPDEDFDLLLGELIVRFNELTDEKPKVNQLCFAWYPKNKSVSTDMEMYYCLPLEIGNEYSRCILFFGNEPEDLKRKGVFSDVCTADLKCI